MSAGNDKDHHMQDAGEKKCVALLQQIVEERGISIDNSSTEKFEGFKSYAKERGIESEFNKSVYNQNLDNAVGQIVEELARVYPNCSFGFTDVEKEYRDAAKKGDFLIHVRGEQDLDISVSLKNYKKSINSIQLKSATWSSFLVSLFFDQIGTGKYRNHIDGKEFGSSPQSRTTRDAAFTSIGMHNIISCLDFAEEVQQKIKDDYIDNENARFWDNISSKWKQDCEKYSSDMLDMIVDKFKSIDTNLIKHNILKSAGLTDEEEMLIIGKNGKFVFSLADDRFSNLVKVLHSNQTSLVLGRNKKNLILSFINNNKIIIDIEVPFTLQKNGAWFLNLPPYKGLFYHAKEGVSLSFGERRPKKSKQLATSVNMRLNLKKAKIVS